MLMYAKHKIGFHKIPAHIATNKIRPLNKE